jgi:hypothetical protein
MTNKFDPTLDVESLELVTSRWWRQLHASGKEHSMWIAHFISFTHARGLYTLYANRPAGKTLAVNTREAGEHTSSRVYQFLLWNGSNTTDDGSKDADSEADILQTWSPELIVSADHNLLRLNWHAQPEIEGAQDGDSQSHTQHVHVVKAFTRGRLLYYGIGGVENPVVEDQAAGADGTTDTTTAQQSCSEREKKLELPNIKQGGHGSSCWWRVSALLGHPPHDQAEHSLCSGQAGMAACAQHHCMARDGVLDRCVRTERTRLLDDASAGWNYGPQQARESRSLLVSFCHPHFGRILRCTKAASNRCRRSITTPG